MGWYCARARFYPSRRGGHKNSENAATFSEFLGRRKNLALALIASRSRVAAGKRYERDTLIRERGEEDLCRPG